MSADTVDQDTCRKIFDDISLRVISLLEQHPAACGVEFSDQPGVTQAQLVEWEVENYPYVLPEDFKAFLAISNGVDVRWSLRFRGDVIPFGRIHVNKLDQLRPLPAGKLERYAANDKPRYVAQLPPGAVPQAFDLDAECSDGRVALLYWTAAREGCGTLREVDGASTSTAAGLVGRDRQSRSRSRRGLPQACRPQVWFQDPSCRWHFIADSFTDYFRLVAMHMGVPQWQYAFTDLGLDPVARHWLALFCPERLAVA